MNPQKLTKFLGHLGRNRSLFLKQRHCFAKLLRKVFAEQF